MYLCYVCPYAVVLWCLKMAQVQLRDEHGNPIQLTDPYGKPVWLTDQYGNPVLLTGVVGVSTSSGATTAEKGVHGGRTVADLIASHEERSESESERAMHVVNENDQIGQLHRSSSTSSSSSEEDDGEGGRRKKGVKDKIKEKVGGVKEHSHTATEQYEKKSIIEKIKEKLPGQQNNH